MSGVRSSCDTVARNSSLARLAASASGMRLLRIAIEAGALHLEGGAVGQLADEGLVVRIVGTPRCEARHQDHADDGPLQAERRAQQAVHRILRRRQQLPILGMHGPGERLGVHLRDDDRTALADHLGGETGARGLGHRRQLVAQHGRHLRVRMVDGHRRLPLAVGADQTDRAHVADPLAEVTHDRLQHGVEVEARLGEHPRRLGERLLAHRLTRQPAARGLRLAIETRVVDRQTGAARELLRQLEVRVLVAPSRLAREQRQRADDLGPGAERDDEQRGEPELADERGVLGVLRQRVPERVDPGSTCGVPARTAAITPAGRCNVGG